MCIQVGGVQESSWSVGGSRCCILGLIRISTVYNSLSKPALFSDLDNHQFLQFFRLFFFPGNGLDLTYCPTVQVQVPFHRRSREGGDDGWQLGPDQWSWHRHDKLGLHRQGLRRCKPREGWQGRLSTWIESNGQGDKEISKIFNFLSLRGHFSFISESIVNLLFNFLFPFQQLELRVCHTIISCQQDVLMKQQIMEAYIMRHS